MTFKSCKRANARVLTVESLNERLNYEIHQLEKRLEKLKNHN